MSAPFKLYRLQQIDSQRDKVLARKAEIEAVLNSNEALQQAEQEVQQAEQELQGARKILQHAENDVQSQNVKIEQTESTLYGGKVRNPKELQDLQAETAALKRHLSVLEDRQLEAMLVVETAEDVSQASNTKLQAVKVHDEQTRKELNVEKTKLLSDLARLDDERKAASGTIDLTDITLYDGLRLNRRGVAVVHVTDNYCPACGSTLSSALLHSARQATQILRCEACGRILYAG